MTLQELINKTLNLKDRRGGADFVKAIVITPDDNRVIELDLVQILDRGNGEIIFQLKAKD